MADVYCIVRRTVKITEEAPVVTLKRPLAYDNAYAHAVEVTVINDDDTPADLTGAGIVATMLRADGRGVSPINGTITGNIAQVILPPSCYVVPGRIKLTVNLAKPTSPAGVDAFSASTAYSKGDLVVVDGIVYRFTDDHPQGEWTGTDATPDSTVRTILWVEGTAERNTSNEMVDPGSSYGITAAIGAVNAAAASAAQAAAEADEVTQTFRGNFDKLVLTQQTQPDETYNKVWVQPDVEEYVVPTMDELNRIMDSSVNEFYVTDRTNRVINDVSFTFHDDGSFTAVGTPSDTINLYIMGDTTVATTHLTSGVTYTCSRWIVSGSGNVRLRNATAATNIITGADAYMTSTITPDVDTKVSIQIGRNVAVNGTFRFQIEKGSTATDYQTVSARDVVARENLNSIQSAIGVPLRYRYITYTSSMQGASEGIQILSNNNIRYDFVHSIVANKNCNCWRMFGASLSNDDFSFVAQLTTSGEWECALRMGDWNDFCGGYRHGNEVFDSLSVWVDGERITDITARTAVQTANEIRIVETTTIYSNLDSTAAVAKHGIEYIFKRDSLTINQSVNWLVSGSLNKCYLSMFPTAKAQTTHYIPNSSFETIAFPNTDNFDIEYPQTTSTMVYGSHFLADFSVEEYPTGMTGGDTLLVTDNYVSSSTLYNKLYYRVCSSGTVNAGDIWKTTTVYKLTYN